MIDYDDGGFLRRETACKDARDNGVQCEFCDQFTDEPMPGYDRCFCSDDCAQEYADEVRIANREAAREYELHGDDLDSWYR